MAGIAPAMRYTCCKDTSFIVTNPHFVAGNYTFFRYVSLSRMQGMAPQRAKRATEIYRRELREQQRQLGVIKHLFTPCEWSIKELHSIQP